VGVAARIGVVIAAGSHTDNDTGGKNENVTRNQKINHHQSLFCNPIDYEH